MVALAGMAAGEEIKKKTGKRKLTYKYNWNNAFLHLRAGMVELFSSKCVVKLLDKLIENISNTLLAIKEGRKFSRTSLGKPTWTNQYYR